MRDLVYLNGRILPRPEARIDPWDRGLLFGDALYEVVKVLEGVLLELEPHLARLARGLEIVEIPEPAGLREILTELVTATGLTQGSVYLQVTRGVAPRAHLPPPTLAPTVLAVPSEWSFPPPAGSPMTALSVPDRRWGRCDVKTTSMMATVLGKLAARRAAVDEVLFRGEEGELREGGSTNLFVRRDGALETHPRDERILPGVTRAALLHLAEREGWEVRERAPRLAERDGWEEALLCGTLTGVQGLVALDGAVVGEGRVGPWTRRLAEALAAYEGELVAAARP